MGDLARGTVSEEPLDTGVGASEGDPEPNGAEPKPITREETQALIDAGIDKAVSKATRVSQSLVDKADHRISGRLASDLKQLEQYAADLKAAGHELPAEVVERVKQDVVLRSLTGEPAQGDGPSGGLASGAGPTGKPGEVDSDQATGMVAISMMEEADCFIEDGDVELKLIDTKTKSTTKFLRSIDTAIIAKQKRLAGASEDEPEGEEDDDEGENDKGPRARIPVGKGKRSSKKIPDGLSAMDYLRRGYSKSKK